MSFLGILKIFSFKDRNRNIKKLNNVYVSLNNIALGGMDFYLFNYFSLVNISQGSINPRATFFYTLLSISSEFLIFFYLTDSAF